ncbi:hypothetical protein BaRGS_00009801 [Batillaria attramentaria]|uniref:Uncharacterized protein n=1 Tax=Batillaria attramentaria TaxID=370345 RepID=A0ABD0LHH8_9CAEN
MAKRTVLFWVSVAAYILSFASGNEDFVEDFHRYEFIYHDGLDLLLVLHEDRCYFVALDDNPAEDGLMTEHGRYANHRDDLEDYVIRTIHHRHDLILHTNLDHGITSGADDFDVTAHPFHQGHFVSYDEFEFVYHHSHDLLLVMHDNKCYFGKLIDNSGDEDRMMDNDNYRRFMEGHLMRVLPDGYFHLPVQDSDLTAMRDEFQDLLANFRCEDTDIYTFEMEVKMRDNPQFHMPELCLRTRPSASSQWSSWSASDPRWCSGDTHSTGGSQVLTTGAKDFDVTAHPLQPDVHHPGRFVSNVYDEFEFVYHSSHVSRQ